MPYPYDGASGQTTLVTRAVILKRLGPYAPAPMTIDNR